MKRVSAVIVAIVLVSLCASTYAQPAKNNQKRIESLEKQVRDLMRVVKSQGAALKDAQDNQSKFVSKETFDAARVKMLDAASGRPARAKGFNMWSTLDVQLYGKIKMDASYDTARGNTGNFVRWVEPRQTRSGDDQFNMTANETRLGLKFTGPTTDTVKTSGVLEMDFYGGGGENSPHPRMRHAYMKFDMPDQKLSLLAGQTWDVISPLNPGTINYTVMWWTGNIGVRRPQIRLTKGFSLNEDTELTLQGAILRNMGDATGFGGAGDSGEDSGFPSVQGRASVTFPLCSGKKATFGVSGHFGQEEYDIDNDDHNVEVYSWSGNIDAKIPINNWLTLKAEAFTGANLDTYAGGIGQGVSVVGSDVSELESSGGWFALSIGPWDKWSFNVGAGGEIITSGVTTAASTRESNTHVFGNVIYKINDHASFGFELSNSHTDYKNASGGNNVRAQTSFVYKF
ncbi:MAG: hypothetical protein HN350_10245 [Phycisphaerales bacterium]|jgi:hypothetical protein|nr:hypothetical protein [Phycisphaerales bacterium]